MSFNGRRSVVLAAAPQLKEKTTNEKEKPAPNRATAPGYKVPSHKADPARKAIQDANDKVDNEEAILLQGVSCGKKYCESIMWNSAVAFCYVLKLVQCYWIEICDKENKLWRYFRVAWVKL